MASPLVRFVRRTGTKPADAVARCKNQAGLEHMLTVGLDKAHPMSPVSSRDSTFMMDLESPLPSPAELRTWSVFRGSQVGQTRPPSSDADGELRMIGFNLFAVVSRRLQKHHETSNCIGESLPLFTENQNKTTFQRLCSQSPGQCWTA